MSNCREKLRNCGAHSHPSVCYCCAGFLCVIRERCSSRRRLSSCQVHAVLLMLLQQLQPRWERRRWNVMSEDSDPMVIRSHGRNDMLVAAGSMETTCAERWRWLTRQWHDWKWWPAVTSDLRGRWEWIDVGMIFNLFVIKFRLAAYISDHWLSIMTCLQNRESSS